MSTTVSRARSTPRTSLVLLLGLLFAITTIFASPTNAVCNDDPVSRNRGRRKSCAWLKSKRKRKVTKLCKRKKFKRECSNTCGLCNNETVTCPTNEPDIDSPCEKAQVGLGCPYAYNYVGCAFFTGGFQCSAAGEYTCNNNNLKWEYVSNIPLPCDRPDNVPDPNVQGTTCEPCPQVEPEGICPTEKPTPFEKCSSSIKEDFTCSYDFKVTGCSVESLECFALSFIDCYDGVWGPEGIADPMPCGNLTISV